MDSTDGAEKAGKTSAPSADDMLAQLAGDEIDRLLAEAEAGTPSLATAAPKTIVEPEPTPSPVTDPESAPATSPDAGQSRDELSASLDALLSTVEAPAAESEPVARPEHEKVEATESSTADRDLLSASLDKLLNGSANAEQPAASQFPEAIPEASEHVTSAPASESPVSEHAPSLTSDPDTDTVEVVQKPAPTPPPAEPPKISEPASPAAPSRITPDPSTESHDETPSFFMRFLDVILAPLESIPDAVRDALGKVAVVTLINAIGVIGYVKISRHHHHKPPVSAIPAITAPAAKSPHGGEPSDRTAERSASDVQTRKPGS